MDKQFTITLTEEEMKMILRGLQNRQDFLEDLGKIEESNKCFELESKLWEIKRAK